MRILEIALLLNLVQSQGACYKKTKQQSQPSKPQPSPQTQPFKAGGGSSLIGRLTYYTFGPSGVAYCDGQFYDDNAMIVAVSTSIMQGHDKCHKRVRVTAEGRSVEATVVDMCAESDGCVPGTVDGTIGLWRALGIDMNRGVVEGISYTFL